MYEASFGLKRRPFAATPDATCFLTARPIQAALDELVVCVEQGQGIGILTAPAGTGKTLLCERLRFELGDRFETIFLRHASFLTRRALLQTILCELNLSYNHPSEQELRLELLPAIRALAPKHDALVLICDEAHQLSDSLLEELRILADFAESGRPLVRLVLVGQVSLEEKLAQPSLEAINQRIRAQINLSTFDHAGSLDYIDYRLTWAGGRTNEVFTPAALDLIARASDGVPRCINQLADHTLLLAFVAEQKPAGEELVREALGDLRQLPLHWNEPSPSRSLSEDSVSAYAAIESTNESLSSSREMSGHLRNSMAGAMYSYEPSDIPDSESPGWTPPGSEAAVPPAVPQIPAAYEITESPIFSKIEVTSDDWRHAVDLFNPRTTDNHFTDDETSPKTESISIDDGMSSSLSHRVHFHELLRDAYAAAGELTEHSIGSETVEINETIDIPNDGSLSAIVEELRSDLLRPVDRNEDATVPVEASPDVNDFQEEVIVDRYASIDAGFTPPATSTSDTTSGNEVRDVESDSGSIDSNIASGQSLMDSLDQAARWRHVEQPGFELDSDICDVDSESCMTMDNSESTDTPVDDEIHLVEDSAPSWCGILKKDANEAGSNQTSDDGDRIEQVVNEVFSLGQSLQPTGALSANSESILTALRREVIDLTGVNETAVSDPDSSATRELAWQSVETEPVETTSESRPFRYLFSMLRRKQKGLA